jgi:hypothetical protein
MYGLQAHVQILYKLWIPIQDSRRLTGHQPFSKMFVSIYPLVDRRIFSRQLSIVLIHYDTVVGDGNTSRMAV